MSPVYFISHNNSNPAVVFNNTILISDTQNEYKAIIKCFFPFFFNFPRIRIHFRIKFKENVKFIL